MINSKQLDFMSRQGTDTADPAQLTDINHVSIDTGLSATERMKAYLEQIKKENRSILYAALDRLPPQICKNSRDFVHFLRERKFEEC